MHVDTLVANKRTPTKMTDQKKVLRSCDNGVTIVTLFPDRNTIVTPRCDDGVTIVTRS